MTADLLREAAALMRQRAEAATPGPWTSWGDGLVWPSERGPAANDPICGDFLNPAHDDCGAHIASWHPAVALAVAAWLDREVAEAAPCPCPKCEDAPPPVISDEALAVARAYLGRDQ